MSEMRFFNQFNSNQKKEGLSENQNIRKEVQAEREDLLSLVKTQSKDVIGNNKSGYELLQRFSGEGVDFFNENNLNGLEELSQNERLFLLSMYGKYLTYDLEDFKKYFEVFPSDLEKIKKWFIDSKGGEEGYKFQTRTDEELELYQLAFDFVKTDSRVSSLENFEAYENRSDLRKRANEHLLDGYIPPTQRQEKSPVEKILSRLIKKDKKNLEISPVEEAAILRKKLADMQYRLVEEEFLRYGLHMGSLEKHFDKENSERYEKGVSKEEDYHSMLFDSYHENKSHNDPGKFLSENKYLSRKIINLITELGEIREPVDKNADILIEFWQKNRNPRFFSVIAEALEKLDPEWAGEKSFELLCQEKEITTCNSLVLLISQMIGAENLRVRINAELEKGSEQEEDLTKKNNLEYAYSLITPNSNKEAIRNLQNFYQEKIKFEDYKINKEMNDKEVALLQSLIGKNEKVLEEGCGTGRLLLEMKKTGYDITGFDFTPRHVDEIKKQDSEANVSEDDWHKTKFADESFDTVYSLGRNILHDYSIIDQAQLFREANRILKLGGKFIFDIPNRDKGGYKEMVDEYGNEMKKRGIKNFRQGTIYDSPDGINFATRYAYSKEDIKMLAQMTGFEISLVKKEPLKTGKGDENIYYVLEKKS